MGNLESLDTLCTHCVHAQHLGYDTHILVDCEDPHPNTCVNGDCTTVE